MKATVRIDKAGRIVLPKSMRDHLELSEGSILKVQVAGHRIELSEELPEVKFIREKGLRVFVGCEGFDAAEAVREARERQIERLELPFSK